MLDGKRNARPELQAKHSPAGALGSEQKCLANCAKSLMTIDADGPIRASVILVCRNGASARGRKGLRLSQRNLLAKWISLARLTSQLASHATAQPNDLSRR